VNLAGIIDPHPDGAPALVMSSPAEGSEGSEGSDGSEGEVTTYGSLRRAVSALQSRLADAGIGPDDRVAILSANDPAFVVGYLAVLRAGAVAVPLNIISPPAELQRQLAQVDVSTILVGPGGTRVAGAVEALTGVPVLTVTGDPPPSVGDSPASVDRGPDDLAALLFTAGTAGSPRAARLTHGNLLANLDQVQRHPGRGVESSDRLLGVLPLCHIFGLNAVLGGALYTGASVVLANRFDPVATLELIARHGVTILVGAPTLFAALSAAVPAAADSAAADPLATVRFAFSGAAPLSAEVADGWNKRFGLPLRQGYGLTEASPVVTTSVMDEPARPTSIGVPLPGVEVRLVDDDGDEALAGDPGEIWVRGANVFPGYWHDQAATEAALTADGWLRTGDIAVVGDDGELAIVDRAKDLIIVSGFNVYPAEVEDVLAEHPDVADVAVIGEPDRYRGEVVHAFVVLQRSERPTIDTQLKAQLTQWCAGRLARYKCPNEVTFVPALPHGLAGKLLRRSLRAGAGPAGPPAPVTAT
jgi:long-chain acyl-CoA synthetase